ncbi:MAG: iron-sulfur cluster repair di-iron protein [Reichenbachiella sp.]|uniref:iron-sulfur cluster repair di-iron protein n=1 Tax=Reichenbachiella sp. TaxID=2184521 RepID=UPI0029665555|nr:iron-sulfur cluster repair di-iron protein [Reichenbachiella sp.]MDW3208602.1 iron-sulfur cluster repair di-iron protein [Reichenbachiella sp.]
MENKSIEILINENFVYAKVLDYFGVEYYKSKNKTLHQVCQDHKIDLSQLLDVIDRAQERSTIDSSELINFPARLIVGYLKHAHELFIKDRLPFILRQINALKTPTDQELIEDLKMVLPMFVDDFIHHIYEEEDRLFSYINDLENFVLGKSSSAKVLANINSFSIQKFALHHGDSDDEMKGIRGITGEYHTENIEDIQLKVIFKELQAFDNELTKHAHIENNVLFPKALMLEKQAKEKLTLTYSQN